MKKVFVFILLATVAVSCANYELFELKVDKDLTETFEINIPKTSGVIGIFNLTKTIDLHSGDFAEYLGKVTEIKINSLTYKFKDFTGNTLGTIPSGSLKFDNTIFSTVTGLNLSHAVNSEEVFAVTNPTVINELEKTLLNSNSTIITLSGNALSDVSSMGFKVEVNISLTATIKE
jgi:hypothetical protein